MLARLSAAAIAFVLLSGPLGAAGLLPERVAKAAEERVAAGQYPVLVIGYIDGDKRETVTFGKLPNGKAVTGDTVFEIGSVTKTFTATALAKAVVDGKVQLDTPLAKLVPDWTIPARNGKQITLGDLASQRSGLPRMPGNFAPKDLANPYADYDRAKLKAFLAAYTLPRDPGASFEYSNLGFGTLGLALAEAAQKSYPALINDEIFAPLGMSHSSAANIVPAEMAPGRQENGAPAKNWDFDALAGAGVIRSNANDMLNYLAANMAPDGTALGKAMTLAQTPRAEMQGVSRIGLAWITTAPNNVVWHNGMTGGYASFVGFSADRKHGVVILSSAAQSVDDLGFAALVADTPLAPVQKAIAVSDAALDEYAGEYKLAENFSIRVFRDGHQLYIQATSQGPVPVYASARDAFFARLVAASLTFTRDAAGKVNGLVLHQNGDHPAPRRADKPTVVLDAATLQGYAGKYQLAPNVVFDVAAKDGHLFVQLTGQSSLEVYPSAKDKFFYKVVDAQIEFERDATGKVVALILHQNGRDMRAPRLAP